MVLLKVFLVLCFVAYGTSLNGRPDVDARSPDGSEIMARDSSVLSSGGKAYLDLYIYYGKQFKKYLHEKSRVLEYLEKFLKKVNQILLTAQPILTVHFTLVGAGQWNEDSRALSEDTKTLDSELLTAVLEVFGKRLERRWHKTHGKHIDAVLLLTTKYIRNASMSDDIVKGVAGRIGAICMKEHFVAAVTDKPEKFTGVRSAATQLSILMGAVKDGQGPPGNEFVRGSDGAKWCKYDDGYLLGSQTGKNSDKLSECSASSFIFGIRQQGPGCYDRAPRNETLDNEIPE